MAQGYKDFTAGAVLTAADLEDYNQNQSIMRFASAAARDSALSVVKTEGMMAYLIDVNTLTVYNGSVWSTMGPAHGAGLAWTPVLTQSGAVTKTVNNGSYFRLGRLVFAEMYLTATGAGTASNFISFSLPVTAASSSPSHVGYGYAQDTSVPGFWGANAVLANTTTFVFYAMQIQGGAAASTTFLMGSGASSGWGTQAIASGDIFTATIMYVAAADA